MFDTAYSRSLLLQTRTDTPCTSTAFLVPGGSSDTFNTRAKALGPASCVNARRSTRRKSLSVRPLRVHGEVFLDCLLEMADAHFLIIAERQAVFRARLEPFLL